MTTRTVPVTLTALAALALGPLAGAGAARAEFTLHVLHINDFHSRVESINAFDSSCDTEGEAAGECFGGIARLASAITDLRDQIRAEGGNVILLDSGDQFQGSLFYTTYKGEDTAEFMNALGFDAMAVGNHEFDDGPEGLAGLIEAVRFPVISGNLDVSVDNQLAGRLERMAVIEVGGEKIGIISALAVDTPETSSPGPTVVFADEADSLRADAAELAGQGVNKIIALTHVGYRRDQQLAEAVPGLDAIIGGHSHTLLGEMEGAAGPYPTRVAGPEGEVPVYTAYAYGKYLGHAVLTFDDEGRLIEAGGAPVLMDASIEPDAAFAARVEELAGPIAELRDRIVAEVAAPVDADRNTCRQRECAMGNLVADAMLDRVRAQGIEVAVMNGGGLRASIAGGPVSMGAVYDVLPFQNMLATFRISGAGLLAALENGASQYEDIAGRFAQVAGLRYTVDPSQPAGSRISAVEVMLDGAWTPLDPERVYGVVTNDYTRRGGDGYAVFATEAQDAYDFGPDLAEVLVGYLQAQGPGFTAPADEGRITVIE